MDSQSLTETTHTLLNIGHIETYSLDTKSAKFRSTLDLGVAQIGELTIKATRYDKSKWVDINPLADDPAILAGGTEAGELFARRNRDPAHAARMSAATKKLGHALESTYGKRTGLLALRMKAGFSQTELAQRMGTHQPGIARWERSPTTMSVQNIKAMATALGVSAMDVFSAIEEQREIEIKAAEHESA